MATASMSSFLRRLTRGMAAETLRDQSDRQLVERLLTGRDEAAFEAVVRRHGPMVYRVCWRVLQQEQDAEDAFQATFLVLAQQLRTVRRRASLASWLHGVARRVALKAGARAATRRRHERKAAAGKFPPEEVPWRELRAVLDAELERLPEKWRLPLILCYLQGRTQDEAAQQLGSSPRTLRRRLEEARAALGRRLTGRGVVWPAALSAVLLSDCVAPAALAPRLVGPTVEAAACIAAGQAALTAAVSAPVAALTEGVLKAMQLTKLKIATIVVVVGALGIGASALPYRTAAAEPPRPVSKSAVPVQDQGNLKETVLALEKRIWEAHTKQDLDTFKNLLADDFVGTDMFGRPYDKAATLDYVAKFRVIEHELKDVKVIPLNPTSAVLSYEVHYKVRPTDGEKTESTTRRATTAWVQRKGRWYYVYFEDKLVHKDGAALKVIGFDGEGIREILLKTNREKDPPKD